MERTRDSFTYIDLLRTSRLYGRRYIRGESPFNWPPPRIDHPFPDPAVFIQVIRQPFDRNYRLVLARELFDQEFIFLHRKSFGGLVV